MPFEQKVVVITGASRGIGASLVERFRKIGYGVVANSRSIDAAGDPAVLVVDGDIAGRDTAERVVNIERFGRIDTLINNAGVFIPKQFIDYSETDFATMIAVNLGGSSTSRRRQQPGRFGRVPATSSMSRRRVWLGRRCIRARCTSSSQVYSPWAEWPRRKRSSIPFCIVKRRHSSQVKSCTSMAAGPQAAAEEERMWPNRSLIELFEIEHPLVLAPMAGLGTVELAASVCEAGGLGSIGCATMQPQLVAKSIQELRGLTSKPINVNFFCHAQANLNPDGEHAWQERLLPYYHELGIDYEPPRSRLDIAPFGDAVCTVIEGEARSGEFPFWAAGPGLAGPGQGGRLPRHVIGNDGRGGAMAGSWWRRCNHRSGL
jgi:NAD(P)-dependent dehydrogenase (short-subunit alcohol dehydrogenase family)